MRRYYFHVRDGQTVLDDTGMELPDLTAVRQEPVQAATGMLSDWGDKAFSSGEPWTMWVTENADGTGPEICKLNFAAK